MNESFNIYKILLSRSLKTDVLSVVLREQSILASAICVCVHVCVWRGYHMNNQNPRSRHLGIL